MNCSELIDLIEGGPTELKLDVPLNFRRRTRATRAHPVDLNDLLQALRSNVTIKRVTCETHIVLEVTESEWERILVALGGMHALKRLRLYWTNGSQDFHPLQAIARAVDVTKALPSLHICSVLPNTTSDPSGAAVLAASLRRNATSLTYFLWHSETHHPANNMHEAIFHALADLRCLRQATIWDACSTLGADCIRPLAHSPSLGSLYLRLCVEHWTAVAEVIRSGSCRIENLFLYATPSRSLPTGITTTNVIQTLATSLEQNTSLRTLDLYLWSGFSDEAVVALAKALTVNTRLRSLQLSLYRDEVEKVWAQTRHLTTHVHGCEAYKAMAEMLKSKKEPLELKLPAIRADASPETRKQKKLYYIHNTLNSVRLGKLMATSPASKEAWVHAFDKLNSGFVVDREGASSCHHLGCLFTLLQLNPSICPVRNTVTIHSDLESSPLERRKSKRLQAASRS